MCVCLVKWVFRWHFNSHRIHGICDSTQIILELSILVRLCLSRYIILNGVLACIWWVCLFVNACFMFDAWYMLNRDNPSQIFYKWVLWWVHAELSVPVFELKWESEIMSVVVDLCLVVIWYVSSQQRRNILQRWCKFMLNSMCGNVFPVKLSETQQNDILNWKSECCGEFKCDSEGECLNRSARENFAHWNVSSCWIACT